MLFPIFFGHLTFASHRCWKVFIKKAVYLAAEAWRQQYGKAVRHSAKSDAGGDVLQYARSDADPYRLVGWETVPLEDGSLLYQSPDGYMFTDLREAYEHEVANKQLAAGGDTTRAALSFLQRFLNEHSEEREERSTEDHQRVVVSTSTLEDWLHRGDDPILAPMSYQVYAMWVFRIEKPPRAARSTRKSFRHIDIDFASHYQLCTTHAQRLATELRVPMFEGFIMPSHVVDAETAALYKQLLLRPLSMPADDGQPEDLRITKAFAPLSAPMTDADQQALAKVGSRAFSTQWVSWQAEQERRAMQGRRHFLDRFEYPSIWETAEVKQRLNEMWTEEEEAEPGQTQQDPEYCKDKDKPRATVEEYVAIIGQEVAVNLEGIARARLEKKPRQYQVDAAVHAAHIKVTTGGGLGNEDADGEAREYK